MSEKETIYYLETADGDLVRVSESKLKEFSEMQKAQKLSAQKKETPTDQYFAYDTDEETKMMQEK